MRSEQAVNLPEFQRYFEHRVAHLITTVFWFVVMFFAFWLKNHEHQPHYLHHRWLWLLHTQPYAAKLIPADFCWLRLKMIKPVDVLENAQKWGGSFKGAVPDRVVDRAGGSTF